MSDEGPKRLTAEETASAWGYDSINRMVEEVGNDSIVPACCEDGCETEPDGCCPHGHPSILLDLGLI